MSSSSSSPKAVGPGEEGHGPSRPAPGHNQRARPPRHVAPLTIPQVNSINEFGLMVSRQLTQCRRYGGRLAVMWLEAEPVEAVQAEGADDAQATLMTAVGRRLRSRVRGTDAVLQVGDGSFAVLLMEAGGPEGELVRQRLHHALGGSYGVGEGLVMHVRLRIGVAAFPNGGSRGTELAQSAREDLRSRAG